MENIAQTPRPVITWFILVYDSTAEERFPLKRKWYIFSYDKATQDEIAAVLKLVNGNRFNECSDTSERKPGQATVTMSLNSDAYSTSRKILQYRHLFEPVEESRLGSFIQGALEKGNRWTGVTLDPDSYFEDENENAISMVDIEDREARREGGDEIYTIVFNHPESVLRFGPEIPIRPELWLEADAGLFAEFFKTYSFLVQSRWLSSRCEVSPSKTSVSRAILPVQEDCMSIILPFRKLYSSDAMDDLFNRVCGIHNRHCRKDSAHFLWVTHHKKAFNNLLNTQAHMLWVEANISTRSYLDAFAYGASIVHATSRSTKPQDDIERLLENNDRNMVIMGYHYILRNLLSSVGQALQIIRQNILHWTRDLNWAKPTRLAMQDLFGDSPSARDDMNGV